MEPERAKSRPQRIQKMTVYTLLMGVVFLLVWGWFVWERWMGGDRLLPMLLTGLGLLITVSMLSTLFSEGLRKPLPEDRREAFWLLFTPACLLGGPLGLLKYFSWLPSTDPPASKALRFLLITLPILLWLVLMTLGIYQIKQRKETVP